MSPRRGDDNPGGTVTLMPFLAVLLCTMGALIMLLVLIAKDARDTLTTTNLAASEDWTNYRAATEELDWLGAQYEASLPRLEEDVAMRRAELASLEDLTRRRRDEVELLAKTLDALRQNPDPRLDATTVAQQLTAAEQSLTAAQQKLQQLREHAANAKRSFSITPAIGRNGTRRRPMFIECRDNTVILQPEGIVLTPQDFVTAGRPDAPLDVALRAQRQYFAESGIDDEPYPLVVVRPSGAAMFPVVRASLGSWLSDFGYELIDEDWSIVYPQANPEVHSRLESQLASSRQRLRGYLATLADNGESAGGDLVAEVAAARSGTARTAVSPWSTESGGVGTYRVGRGGMVERIDSAPQAKIGRSLAAINPDSGDTTNNENDNTTAPSPIIGLGRPQRPAAPESFPDVPPAQFYADNGEGAAARNEYLREIVSPENVTARRPNTPESRSNNKADNSKHANSQASGMPSSLDKTADEWGLRDAAASARPVTRSMRVICGADHVSLPQQPGLIRTRRVQFDSSNNDSNNSATTETFVREVWDFMETWGIAGASKYWKPVLKVSVEPGGDATFEQLRHQLRRSGFEIERE